MVLNACFSPVNDFWKTYMAAGSEKVFMTPSGKATILVDMCKSLLSFIPMETPIQFLSEPIFGESDQLQAEQGTRIVLMEEGNVNLNEFPIEFDPNMVGVLGLLQFTECNHSYVFFCII